MASVPSAKKEVARRKARQPSLFQYLLSGEAEDSSPQLLYLLSRGNRANTNTITHYLTPQIETPYHCTQNCHRRDKSRVDLDEVKT